MLILSGWLKRSDCSFAAAGREDEMAGSSFGKVFRITTWGESHGPAVGVVIDGCPAGFGLEEADIQVMLDRRKPGQGKYSTARAEEDRVRILSGVFEGKTTGTPISLMIENRDHRSADYSAIRDVYRPGHADYTYDEKYGIRDYRGGGRASGRETACRVAAGAVAEKLLKELGVTCKVRPVMIGGIPAEEEKTVRELLDAAVREGDSVGGTAECIISGVPAGLGEPVFDKADARLAAAVMSIGAVKGVEIGDGYAAAGSRGSENNDALRADEAGRISKLTNHSGGILGGITDGSDIIIRAAFKPTPSIAKTQESINSEHENVSLSITGRHDPVTVYRGMVVMEAMAALTILDMMLENMSAQAENVIRFYGNRK